MHAVQHAPKLAALQDLLQQCSIVGQPEGIGEGAHDLQEAEAGTGGHRVLVFAQLRAVLDLVASDVLVPLGVPFLRLDGR